MPAGVLRRGWMERIPREELRGGFSVEFGRMDARE